MLLAELERVGTSVLLGNKKGANFKEVDLKEFSGYS